MVTFKCKLIVGKYLFNSFIRLNMESSRKSLGDKATISLSNPLRQLDSNLNVGDAIEIWLGYDDELNQEFVGYISEIKPNHPFEIECEDESFNMKRTNVNETWKSVSLKELILYLVPGAVLAAELPQITLSNFRLDNMSKYKALEQLRNDYKLDVYFRKGKLFVGLAYTDTSVPGNIIYSFQRNIISRGCELVYRKKEDVKAKLKAISVLPDGSKTEASVGDDDGAEYTWLSPTVIKDQATLGKLAAKQLDKYKYDGYSGSFKTWLLPYPQHGQIAVFKDAQYPERQGSYFMDSVSTEITKSGGCRRLIKPGAKANG